MEYCDAYRNLRNQVNTKSIEVVHVDLLSKTIDIFKKPLEMPNHLTIRLPNVVAILQMFDFLSDLFDVYIQHKDGSIELFESSKVDAGKLCTSQPNLSVDVMVVNCRKDKVDQFALISANNSDNRITITSKSLSLARNIQVLLDLLIQVSENK